MPTMSNDAFDAATDDATHSVITEFEKHGAVLPEGDELLALMVQINDALTAIMQDYR